MSREAEQKCHPAGASVDVLPTVIRGQRLIVLTTWQCRGCAHRRSESSDDSGPRLSCPVCGAGRPLLTHTAKEKGNRHASCHLPQ